MCNAFSATSSFGVNRRSGVCFSSITVSQFWSALSIMLSRISKNAARRSFAKSLAGASSRRAFVQPSGADRASVVDVPATYQDDNHFTPRPGDFPENKK